MNLKIRFLLAFILSLYLVIIVDMLCILRKRHYICWY
ncbi:MAG: hypothetical protein PME_37080 [Priestia megaterium]